MANNMFANAQNRRKEQQAEILEKNITEKAKKETKKPEPKESGRPKKYSGTPKVLNFKMEEETFNKLQEIANLEQNGNKTAVLTELVEAHYKKIKRG